MSNLYYAVTKYLNLVPKRFRGISGINDYSFKVLNPCHIPIVGIVKINGTIEKTEQSAFCSLRNDNGFTNILIRREKCEDIFEAIIAAAKMLWHSPYAERYMRVYKEIERLDSKTIPEVKAIRHALSHSPTILQRRNTVEVLETLFGTKHMDLTKYQHLKVFFSYYVSLLIQHDNMLYSRINSSKFQKLTENDSGLITIIDSHPRFGWFLK